MADISKRGTYRPAAPRPAGEPSADQIFRMPTLAEVTSAGYPTARWAEIKREHTELVRRFHSDPEFRARVIAEWKARR